MQQIEPVKRKAPSTAFKKGVSGNPGGRKQKTDEERDLEALCRQKSPAALDTIIDLMRTGGDKVKLSAATYIIDRGWGKPVSKTEISGANGNPIQGEFILKVGFVGSAN